MLGYRQKILISDAVVFFVFIALFFFFVDKTAAAILNKMLHGSQSFLLERKEIKVLISQFKISALLFGSGMLLSYSLLMWAIVHQLSRPLQKIIDTIVSYREGDLLPRISKQKGEFGKLAFLLNSLTERIEKQIEHLKQQKQDTEEILESLEEGVVALNTQGTVKFVNQAACKMLGASCDAMLGSLLASVKAQNHNLMGKCHEVVQQALQTSEAVEQTWNSGCTTQYLELIALPRIGQRGAILVIQDKTSDHKMLEMGKDFIANASHELRTPITIIRGFAETLQEHPQLTPEMQKEITQKIVRTSIRLDKLIKGLLTLADIERLSGDKFQPTDLISLTEHCTHLLLTAEPKVEIKFTGELSQMFVSADPLLLDLAIMNLLENAVKYSTSPVRVELSIYTTEREAHLEVRDWGIGIPNMELPYIFDRFYTVDKARSRKSGGAGLGLSIVKTIIEKHRGKISVASEIGRGSTFKISLPLYL